MTELFSTLLSESVTDRFSKHCPGSPFMFSKGFNNVFWMCVCGYKISTSDQFIVNQSGVIEKLSNGENFYQTK